MPGCPQPQGCCSKPCKSYVDGPRVVAVPCTAKRCHTSLRNACPVHRCQSFPHPISIQHTHPLTLSSPFAFSTHTHTPCPNPIGIQHTHPLPPPPLVPSHTTHPYSDLQATCPSPPGWPGCQTPNWLARTSDRELSQRTQTHANTSALASVVALPNSKLCFIVETTDQRTCCF